MDFRLRWKFTDKCVIFFPSSDSFLLKPLCAHPIFQSVRFDPGASLAHALCALFIHRIRPKATAFDWTDSTSGDMACLNMGGRGGGGVLSHT